MLKREKKEIIFGRIGSVLKSEGYKFRSDGGLRYYLDKGSFVVSWVMFLYNYGGAETMGCYLGIKEVEDLILKLVDEYYPGVINIYKKLNLIPTIRDQESVFHRKLYMLDTPRDVEMFCEEYLDYIRNAGSAFIERYSYLPNVLERMDGLKSQGLEWQDPNQGILYGSIDADFRGLIISKLCNDPNLDTKIEVCNEIFRDPQYKEWHPYYEKLKQLLPSIEPKYNV